VQQPTVSRTGAVDQSFADVDGTTRKSHRNALGVHLADIDHLFP
jgi:hypothetical protein